MAEVPKELNEHFGFLSLTDERNNLLMWSHYTDAHKGFVVGFYSESPFFKPGDGKTVDGLRKVEYAKLRWFVPKGGWAGLTYEQKRKANLKAFFTKSPEWAYEKEFRILAHPKHADKTLPGPGGHDVRLYNFPPQRIREIILGYRMGKANREKIVKIMRQKYPHAEIFEAVLSETEFAVDIVPLLS